LSDRSNVTKEERENRVRHCITELTPDPSVEQTRTGIKVKLLHMEESKIGVTPMEIQPTDIPRITLCDGTVLYTPVPLKRQKRWQN
jgi:hypothetical protein